MSANNVQAIQALPEPVKGLVLSAFSAAIDDVFRFGVPVAIAALIVAFFIKEIPLRAAAHHPGEAPAAEALSVGI
jgi:hypothetical protein